jgi:hypothetical protein
LRCGKRETDPAEAIGEYPEIRRFAEGSRLSRMEEWIGGMGTQLEERRSEDPRQPAEMDIE